jgi:hypothetical protein
MAVDRQHPDRESRSVTLSANCLKAGFASIDVDDPTLTLVKDGRYYGIESGKIIFENPVICGSDLRFEFSVPGRYAADICIECPENLETVVRLTELRKTGIKGLPGSMRFGERYSPCRDRLTFLFDVADEKLHFLTLELKAADCHVAFKWATFTRV